MQATLNIKPNEIDEKLLHVIKELLSKNIEIILKSSTIEFLEFDAAMPLNDVMEEFQKAGYSKEFLCDLKAGFETSEIYAQ